MPGVNTMLYNAHIATFVKVVECGSFRRAADQIGISPSAVLKQIALLEQNLEVSLLDRSRKGVTLTEAGNSIYRDAKYIIQYCSTAADRAREIYTRQTNVVRIGVSALTLVQPLVSLWPSIQKIVPELKCRFTTFDCSKEGVMRSLTTLGQDSDMVLAVYDEQLLKACHLQGLKLDDAQVVIAEGENPRDDDASLPPLCMEDLQGRNILVPRQGLFKAADEFRAEVSEHYPSIHIEDFEMYCPDLYYQCQGNTSCIFTYDIWHMGHMLLRHRQVNWDYKSNFGILYSENCSLDVLKMIDAVRTVIQGK